MRLPLLVAGALLAAASAAAAHDFWLVPNAFTVARGETLDVSARTSSRFPTSESAVAPERVKAARLISSAGESPIADLSVAGKSLRLRHRPDADGQYVVAVALVRRESRTTPTLVVQVAPGGHAGHNRPAQRESNGDVALPLSTVASDSQDVADAVGRFHAALAAGDSVAALALLSDDVTILESGGVESRTEYRSHHLPGDMAFARAIPSKRSGLAVRLRGEVAWVTSTSRTEGEFRGRKVNSTGAELAILSREPSGWRIRAIHWSSRASR